MFSLPILLTSALAGLASARSGCTSTWCREQSVFSPPSHQQQRCGEFLAPRNVFLLSQDRPDEVIPANHDRIFEAYKKTRGRGDDVERQYVLVQFPRTKPGSYGCQLRWDIPELTEFGRNFGGDLLDVKIIRPVSPSQEPTWSNLIEEIHFAPVWGSVRASRGEHTVVNTARCDSEEGLSVVFKLSAYQAESDESQVSFRYGGPEHIEKLWAGPSLDYNC